MTLKKYLFAFACSSLLSTAVLASADQAISSAEAAQQAAAKAGYEWRDTAIIIKQAKKLAQEGKSEEAIQLAKKAEQQGHNALNQYHNETARYNQNH